MSRMETVSTNVYGGYPLFCVVEDPYDHEGLALIYPGDNVYYGGRPRLREVESVLHRRPMTPEGSTLGDTPFRRASRVICPICGAESDIQRHWVRCPARREMLVCMSHCAGCRYQYHDREHCVYRYPAMLREGSEYGKAAEEGAELLDLGRGSAGK